MLWSHTSSIRHSPHRLRYFYTLRALLVWVWLQSYSVLGLRQLGKDLWKLYLNKWQKIIVLYYIWDNSHTIQTGDYCSVSRMFSSCIYLHDLWELPHNRNNGRPLETLERRIDWQLSVWTKDREPPVYFSSFVCWKHIFFHQFFLVFHPMNSTENETKAHHRGYLETCPFGEALCFFV